MTKCLGVNSGGETLEKGRGGIDGLVDESSIGSRGIDERYCTVGIVLAVSLVGQGARNCGLVGKGIDIEAEVVIGK